jgi:hypothetical protein
MAKSRECLSEHGRATFYAAIWDDLRNAALDCGWALGLHGSLQSDMDIMAMPWVEDAKPAEDMIQALIDCFTPNPFDDISKRPNYDKPNNRVVYTIHIWGDLYLDVNIIKPNKEKEARRGMKRNTFDKKIIVGEEGARNLAIILEITELRHQLEASQRLSEERRAALAECSPWQDFYEDDNIDGEISDTVCRFCDVSLYSMAKHKPDCDWVRLSRKEE